MTINGRANWETLNGYLNFAQVYFGFNLKRLEVHMKFVDEDTMKDKHGIYKITNKENGMTYIGQTMQRFQKRYWHHNWKLKDGTHDNMHLQNAWNKYGESAFEFSIVETMESHNNDTLNDLEIKYIQMYRDENRCYNIADGGDGFRGVVLTEEHRRKIGEKNRINMLGKKHNEETKRKMSEAHYGKHYNKDNYKLTDEQAFEIKTRLVSGEKPSSVAKNVGVDYRYVNNIISNNTWHDIQVDGWDEFRANRRTWTRLTPEDHKEIYRLHVEEGYTKQELAEMYHKTNKMIAKIFKKFDEQNELDNHMTIQCQAS